MVSRSVSGMVSSSVGSSMVTSVSMKSLLKSTPAAFRSSSNRVKMATSSPVDRSAVFMRLW